MSTADMAPTFVALSPDCWNDLVALFGPRGAVGGCWCMWWRLSHSEFEGSKGVGNRRRMKALVDSDQSPGILAYVDDRPVGWCAVAPREEFRRLHTSRILKPIDDAPVWSIVCLFVAREFRRRDLSRHLIRAAAEFAVSSGAEVVEAYPVIPKKSRVPDAFVWTGIAAAFARAGFQEVARRSETRPIMRWTPTEDT